MHAVMQAKHSTSHLLLGLLGAPVPMCKAIHVLAFRLHMRPCSFGHVQERCDTFQWIPRCTAVHLFKHHRYWHGEFLTARCMLCRIQNGSRAMFACETFHATSVMQESITLTVLQW
mmetsp:Transcript_41800/g.70602  ORF Transcript_41800/g.70602 Transcript_41800/m.70602 type:complete len:116 (-) Transcript_41800:1704-2051(-)